MDLQPQEDPTQVETIDPVLLDSLTETRKRINEEVSKNIEKATLQMSDFVRNMPRDLRRLYEEETAGDEKSSPKCQKPPQRKPVKSCRRNSTGE